jgi:hypothetical protein
MIEHLVSATTLVKLKFQEHMPVFQNELTIPGLVGRLVISSWFYLWFSSGRAHWGKLRVLPFSCSLQ